MPRIKDITGNQYNYLRAIKLVEVKKRKTYWLFRCEVDGCGREVVAEKQTVIQGQKKSCGCKANDNRHKFEVRSGTNSTSWKDITGNQYNYLTALKFIEVKNRKSIWLFKCICGDEKEYIGDQVIQGQRKSCGCRANENRNPPHYSGDQHGRWKGVGDLSSVYWKQVKRRERYNSKGRLHEVTITPEYAWNKFVEQNGKCALSDLPISCKMENRKQTASLDRIDSNIGYIEGNVQWLHQTINIMKQEYDQELFIEICKKVSEHYVVRANHAGIPPNSVQTSSHGRAWKGIGGLSLSYWTRVVKRAEKSNLDISITHDFAWKKFLEQGGKCALSGMMISCDMTHNKQIASLDRIDSGKGYTPDNVQWVHQMINFMKSDYSEELFIEMCRKVAEFNKREKTSQN